MDYNPIFAALNRFLVCYYLPLGLVLRPHPIEQHFLNNPTKELQNQPIAVQLYRSCLFK